MNSNDNSSKEFYLLRYIDGLSTFYVRGDGRIVKHRIDRVREKKKINLLTYFFPFIGNGRRR